VVSVSCQLLVKRLHWGVVSVSASASEEADNLLGMLLVSRRASFRHPARCDDGGVKYHRRSACFRPAGMSVQCQWKRLKNNWDALW
jgi:hypothetical protein